MLILYLVPFVLVKMILAGYLHNKQFSFSLGLKMVGPFKNSIDFKCLFRMIFITKVIRIQNVYPDMGKVVGALVVMTSFYSSIWFTEKVIKYIFF